MPLRTCARRRAFGAWLEVGDERFNSDEIQRLYEDGEYPLRKSLSAHDAHRIGSPLQTKLRISTPPGVSKKG